MSTPRRQDLQIQFLASANWEPIWGFMKLGKIKGKSRIREGDGKNNATILRD